MCTLFPGSVASQLFTVYYGQCSVLCFGEYNNKKQTMRAKQNKNLGRIHDLLEFVN